jgi:hypothetical protein
MISLDRNKYEPGKYCGGKQGGMMKNVICATVLAFLFATGPIAGGQEKQSSDTPQKAQAGETKLVQSERSILHLKVTVVFNEYDGEKKVSSLPYVLFLKPEGITGPRPFVGIVRMGVKVPIWTGSKDSAITYQDVGTNLDCMARATEDGRYLLELTVERSSVYPTPTDASEPRFNEHPLATLRRIH